MNLNSQPNMSNGIGTFIIQVHVIRNMLYPLIYEHLSIYEYWLHEIKSIIKKFKLFQSNNNYIIVNHPNISVFVIVVRGGIHEQSYTKTTIIIT